MSMVNSGNATGATNAPRPPVASVPNKTGNSTLPASSTTTATTATTNAGPLSETVPSRTPLDTLLLTYYNSAKASNSSAKDVVLKNLLNVVEAIGLDPARSESDVDKLKKLDFFLPPGTNSSAPADVRLAAQSLINAVGNVQELPYGEETQIANIDDFVVAPAPLRYAAARALVQAESPLKLSPGAINGDLSNEIFREAEKLRHYQPTAPGADPDFVKKELAARRKLFDAVLPHDSAVYRESVAVDKYMSEEVLANEASAMNPWWIAALTIAGLAILGLIIAAIVLGVKSAQKKKAQGKLQQQKGFSEQQARALDVRAAQARDRGGAMQPSRIPAELFEIPPTESVEVVR